MIVFTENIEGSHPHLRVVRCIAIYDKLYYSDCYYEYESAEEIGFAGGIFYETRNGRIVDHQVLLHREHPDFDDSFNSACSAFYRVFALELSYTRDVWFPKNYLLRERYHPDPDHFSYLFEEPPNSLMRTLLNGQYAPVRFKSLIDVEDMDRLYCAFLAQRGNLHVTKSFDECFSGPGYAWHDSTNLFLEKTATKCALPIWGNPESQSNRMSLSSISVFVQNGRYITVRVVRLDQTFEILTDSLDLCPIITYLPQESGYYDH